MTFFLEAWGVNLPQRNGYSPSDWESGLLPPLMSSQPPIRQQVRMEGALGVYRGLAWRQLTKKKKTGRRAGGSGCNYGAFIINQMKLLEAAGVMCVVIQTLHAPNTGTLECILTYTLTYT